MGTQITKRLFRILLIAEWILGLGGAAVSIWSKQFLPSELRAFLDKQADAPLTGLELTLGIAAIGLLLLALVTTIGLFRFKKWARVLFVLCNVLGLILIAQLGPKIDAGLVRAISEVEVLIGGVILALVYWSPISEHFKS